MADPEEDKTKDNSGSDTPAGSLLAQNSSAPGAPAQSSVDPDEDESPLRSAAEKEPSAEATQDLFDLLGTVGNAGLGSTVELPSADSTNSSAKAETNNVNSPAASGLSDSDLTAAFRGELYLSGVPAPRKQDDDTSAQSSSPSSVIARHIDANLPEGDNAEPELSNSIINDYETEFAKPSTGNYDSSATFHDKDYEQAARSVFGIEPPKEAPAIPVPAEKAAAQFTAQAPDAPGQHQSDFAPRARASFARVAEKMHDAISKEHFERITPDAINEIANGSLGASTVTAFSIAARQGTTHELKQTYLDVAIISASTIKEITGKTGVDEIAFHVQGSAPAELIEYFRLGLFPGDGCALIEQNFLRDRLDLDPLSSRLYPPDFDERTGKAISTSQRAIMAKVSIPQQFEMQNLDSIEAKLPPLGTDLRSFARNAQLEGSNLNSYFQTVFFKTNDTLWRSEAIQGLRAEVVSQGNPTAIASLQELIIIKAAIELSEAALSHNQAGKLSALTQLAALEDISAVARQLLKDNAADYTEGISTVDLAREAARDIARSTFEAANYAYAAFLDRDKEKLSAHDRHVKRLDAISKLVSAAEERLNLMARDDFRYLIGVLEAMDALLAIAETNEPQIAAEQVSNLMRMQMAGENVRALEYLTSIHNALTNAAGSPNLELIHRTLSQPTGREFEALKILKACLPDVNAERNAYRLDQIMKGVGPDSSSSELKIASKALEEEDKNFNNAGAAELLKWTRTGESTAKIDEVIKTRNLEEIESVKATAETIKTEMERLSKHALQANEIARTALVGMLMSGADLIAQETWHKSHARKALVPDLSRLSATERSIVREHAALSIEDSLKKNPNISPLQQTEGTGLAIALAETYASGDRNVQKAIESALDAALKCLSRSTAIDGMLQAMSYDLPGTGRLANLVLRAQSSGEGLSAAHRQQLGLLAREGVPGAIRTLAGLCATDNMQASLAANDLVRAGAIPSNRDQVLAIMTDQYKQLSDKHSLLAAIGDIASRDYPARPHVMETIRAALENSAHKYESPEYKSAQKGFLFIAESWGAKEIQTLKQNLRPEMLAALPNIAEKLTANMRELFISSQHELLIAGTVDERIVAVQVLGAFARFVGPEVVNDIGFFSRVQGKAELERANMSKEKVTIFLEHAAKSMLAIMGSANPRVQEAAFVAFRRAGDWPGILGSQSLRNTIIDYVQGRSVELEMNKDAMKLVYDAELARPLSATFKDLGVGGEKISTQQLLQLADHAAANYANADLDGKAVVHKVLTNAATLNALSPTLREKLTGTSVGIDMSQLAGQLINGTVDASIPPNNPLFTDLNNRLINEQRDLESKALLMQLRSAEAAEHAAAEDHLQRKVPIGVQRIGLGKDFVDIFADDIDFEQSRPHQSLKAPHHSTGGN